MTKANLAAAAQLNIIEKMAIQTEDDLQKKEADVILHATRKPKKNTSATGVFILMKINLPQCQQKSA